MSEAGVLEIVTRVCTLLGVVITAIVSIKANRKLNDVHDKQTETVDRVATAQQQLAEVHTTVNHSRDENLQEIAALKREVYRLNAGGAYTPHDDTSIRAANAEVAMKNGMAEVRERRDKP
jgi:hypothetical protein